MKKVFSFLFAVLFLLTPVLVGAQTSNEFVVKDNHTYKIGVVHVLPPDFDLSKKRICLLKDENNTKGYFPIGNGDEEDCSKWDWDDNGERAVITSPYSISDILFSNNQYTSIPNIIRPTFKDDTPETVNVYSLKSIGRYWSDLLIEHGITDTVLGKNPKFDVTLLPAIQKINTLVSNNNDSVKAFFDDAVSSSGLDLSSFDFIVYIQYRTQGARGVSFEQSFAIGNKAYVSFPLQGSKVILNGGFLVVVHELGHAIFGLADLYGGYGIRYPEGVPDPVNFPQKKACIMAMSFGLSKISDSSANKYQTNIYVPETAPPAGLSHFYTEDPNNFILCVDDIIRIVKGKQNPNCPAAYFYAGKCVQATSLNYLSYTNTSPIPIVIKTDKQALFSGKVGIAKHDFPPDVVVGYKYVSEGGSGGGALYMVGKFYEPDLDKLVVPIILRLGRADIPAGDMILKYEIGREKKELKIYYPQVNSKKYDDWDDHFKLFITSDGSTYWQKNDDLGINNKMFEDALVRGDLARSAPSSSEQVITPPNLTLSTTPTLFPRKSTYFTSDQVKVSATIKNTGKGDSGNYIVAIRNKADGSVLGQKDMNNLKLNQKGTFFFTLTDLNWTQEGTNNLEVVIDPDNNISESKENDNSKSLSLKVVIPKPPDLSISKSSLSPRKVTYDRLNKNIKVLATIKNSGDIESGIYTIILRDKASGLVITEQSLKTLKAKGSFNFSYTMPSLDWWAQEGKNNIEIIVDSANAVTESNEDNNSAIVSFTVKSAKPATPLISATATSTTSVVVPTSWTFCANEHDVCEFSGTRQVRYGANGIYITKSFTSKIVCNSAKFGYDPIPNVAKKCEYTTNQNLNYLDNNQSGLAGAFSFFGEALDKVFGVFR